MTTPQVPADWFQSFFQGVVVDAWKACLPREQTLQEVDFIERHLRLQKPARILDVPCGHGRIALELAERGYQLTGVDISADALLLAKQDAEQRGLTIEWRKGDMRDLPWRQHFDAAICVGNSLGYLDEAGDLQFVRAVRDTLKPKAPFLLNVGAVAECLLQFQEDSEGTIGDIAMKSHNVYDPRTGRFNATDTYIRNGVEEVRYNSQRFYMCVDICRMLESASFAVESIFGGLNDEPFKIGAGQLYVVARAE